MLSSTCRRLSAQARVAHLLGHTHSSRRSLTTQHAAAVVEAATNTNQQEPPQTFSGIQDRLPTSQESVSASSFNLPPEESTSAAQAPDDAAHFNLHRSVDFWTNHDTSPSLLLGVTGGPNNVNGVAAEVARHLSSGNPQTLLYWSYHVGRHLFFLSQGVGSLVAHRFFGTASNTNASGGLSTAAVLDKILSDAGNQVSGRLAEALATFVTDWEAIQAGEYKLPWDMTTLSHPQYNLVNVLARSTSFLREAVATLDRRSLQQPSDVWLQSPLYPQYYNSTYHYQTDGWLSSRSANVYEFSTEVLFLGRQDAMQRTTLLPLSAYLAGRDASQCQLLEVAAGTGRLHTFIKDNWPELQTTVTDLSPFYLQQARANMQRWKRLRAAEQQLGGVDDTGTGYIQCAAENLAVESESQDVVVCVYLFHELPPEAREAAVKEMFRVLKPGGLAVLTDSVQLGDRPSWDANLDKFGNFNEPHYDTYIGLDLGALFESAGFACDTKYLSSASKTLSFFKPGTPASDPVTDPAPRSSTAEAIAAKA